MAVSTSVSHRIPAGWYPDRYDRTRRRWWNGTEWTDYYSANPDTSRRLADAIRETGESDTAARRQVHTLTRALTFSDRVPAFILVGLLACNAAAIILLAIVD
jgi:hypothetical protein